MREIGFFITQRQTKQEASAALEGSALDGELWLKPKGRRQTPTLARKFKV